MFLYITLLEHIINRILSFILNVIGGFQTLFWDLFRNSEKVIDLISYQKFTQNLLCLRIALAEGFRKNVHPRNTIVVKMWVALILDISRNSKILRNKV